MLGEEELLESLVNKLQKETEKRAGAKKQSQFKEIWIKKKGVEKLVEYKTRSTILRSKCSWHNEGEKNTVQSLNSW